LPSGGGDINVVVLLTRFLVFDWEEPLFDSYIVEGIIAIPWMKWAKALGWGAKGLKAADKAGDVARLAEKAGTPQEQQRQQPILRKPLAPRLRRLDT
jgi:hypothetical protein